METHVKVTIEGINCTLLPCDYLVGTGVRPTYILVMFEHGGVIHTSKVNYSDSSKFQIKEDHLIKYGYVRPVVTSTALDDIPKKFQIVTPGTANISQEVALGSIQDLIAQKRIGEDTKVLIVQGDIGSADFAGLFKDLNKRRGR